MSSLEFAEHNEKVCNYLYRKADFTDWVITTAFYSAIHFVDHKTFPFTRSINGKRIKYNNLDHYFRFNNPASLSKHDIRSNLVDERHSGISASFHRLMELCFTARYVDYKFPREISEEARNQLKTIKEYCRQ